MQLGDRSRPQLRTLPKPTIDAGGSMLRHFCAARTALGCYAVGEADQLPLRLNAEKSFAIINRLTWGG